MPPRLRAVYGVSMRLAERFRLARSPVVRVLRVSFSPIWPTAPQAPVDQPDDYAALAKTQLD